ncbi:MAG: Hsp20 family protein [Gammaproteobacteria bacterium]|nr:Hsp20 family protein [Gammaproteobacteria bacterium]
MTNFDLTPLYRTSVGFDRMAQMLNTALNADTASNSYPPYNIEVTGEDRYAISIALAGFSKDDLEISVERNVLTVRGKKADDNTERKFLHKGIANRSFERKFNLADHVEVVDADMENGVLVVNLVREIPEAMKPRQIEIGGTAKAVIDHKAA